MISQLDCHTYWGFAIDGFPYIYKQLVTNGSHCLPFSKRVDSALTSRRHLADSVRQGTPVEAKDSKPEP
ncbi:hypothetical protein RO3G_09001 [Rhizopus delemar RA 99-880]|uniref:Uncharacterized protein n=1 Tax=Rhizopus delemar (strain RA 99-880 / ATCC MYA-4621 / FGSC 9543 / NRRL 43880) TaxID=246409 RepID=I1C761_RHIO9|nr:hypothetical protein RO3G_09001 [Rhizopus delemar RA 99-880]|eukprot:EIE84291.1 hypothetical protein RO3G_09001 [Rhizopus delemar RA 99-880]